MYERNPLERKPRFWRDPGIRPTMSNRDAPSGPDRIVFETPLVSAGEFRCPVDDRRFEDTGPTRQYCFVFPRNACWIEQQGSPAFVADCLETIEELGIRGVEIWKANGGDTLTLVPAVNSSDRFVDAVIEIAAEHSSWMAAAIGRPGQPAPAGEHHAAG